MIEHELTFLSKEYLIPSPQVPVNLYSVVM